MKKEKLYNFLKKDIPEKYHSIYFLRIIKEIISDPSFYYKSNDGYYRFTSYFININDKEVIIIFTEQNYTYHLNFRKEKLKNLC